MEWGEYLQDLGSKVVDSKLSAPAASPTVATNPQTGASYTEGKPAVTVASLMHNPLVIAGGVLALALVGYLALRK